MLPCLVPLLAAGGIGASALTAPTAAATPECTHIAPNTTQCDTNGSSQIVTSPSVQTGPYRGWAWGPIVIGGRGR
ncbi:hypothetical protein H7J70_05200 [Mycolicibacterium celeriflavum]|nr:hypothetical protein [Mycolicibacterium celeriflavum]ORA47870.1 hypothetical protein BST21_11725 [Mycolicibacterium celeriflavum]